MHIVPLDKPGRDPRLCSGKRLISLISVLLTVAAAAVNNRAIHEVELYLRPAQFAY